jgi:asparaginyl-tRNA synthetase
MDPNTPASALAGIRNLSTDPKRMAVTKVWEAMMRGARKYCEQEGFAA